MLKAVSMTMRLRCANSSTLIKQLAEAKKNKKLQKPGRQRDVKVGVRGQSFLAFLFPKCYGGAAETGLVLYSTAAG